MMARVLSGDTPHAGRGGAAGGRGAGGGGRCPIAPPPRLHSRAGVGLHLEDAYDTGSESDDGQPQDGGHLQGAGARGGDAAGATTTARSRWGGIIGGVPFLPGIPILSSLLGGRSDDEEEEEDEEEAGAGVDMGSAAGTSPERGAARRASRSSSAGQLSDGAGAVTAAAAAAAAREPPRTALPDARQQHEGRGGAEEDEEDLTATTTAPKPLRAGTQPLPEMSEPSTLMSEEHVRALAAAVPARYRQARWTLLYSTQRDGISLHTLLRRAARKAPTVLVVRDFGRRGARALGSGGVQQGGRRGSGHALHPAQSWLVAGLDPRPVLWHHPSPPPPNTHAQVHLWGVLL